MGNILQELWQAINHFAVCCQEYECVVEIEVKEQVNAFASSPHPNKVFATLLINGNQEKFQLDSGSTVNIMNDGTAEGFSAVRS